MTGPRSSDHGGVETSSSGRVTRIDRGWSSVLMPDGTTARVRNLGMDVAVGDHVDISADGERVEKVHPRASALTRRSSFEGARGSRQVVAANIDTVFLVHAATGQANKRRLERELVLAFDSGAEPVVLLTKIDAVDPSFTEEIRGELGSVAPGVPIVSVSSVTGEGLDQVRAHAPEGTTVAFIGASGVGKSTLINALVGREIQRTGEVREEDQRGRHTTVAAELVPLPGGAWLLDTPGLRAVTLWTSGVGIERAFRDVFDVAEGCRFRDCKHLDEPDCAVRAAVEAGTLVADRVDSMRRLVAEELAVEEEQSERERQMDRRGVRRPKRP